MRNVALKWSVMAALLLCLEAHAFFLLPYTLTIMMPERPGSAILVPKKFSVFVFLGNYYRRVYGPRAEDGKIFIKENHFAKRDKFFKQLLSPPYSWYEDRIREHPEIYGENIELVIEGLRTHEFPREESSSLVLITEHNDFSKPVAMLRVSLPNKNGLLDSENHFQGKGLDSFFPHLPLQRRMMRIPHQSSLKVEDPINLANNLAIEVSSTVVSGAKAEVKNFGMDPLSRIRFFPYLFLIARQHYLFHYGIPSPQELKRAQILTGYSDPGVFITDLYLDCYGTKLNELYTELGFHDFMPPLRNEHTGQLDLHFMHGFQQDVVENHLKNTLLHEPAAVSLVRRLHLSVLKYDKNLATALHTSNCLEEFLKKGLADAVVTAQSWTN